MQEEVISSSVPETSRPGSPWLVRGLAIAGVLLLLVGLLIWWMQRPIRPVTLTEPERQVVEQKVAAIQPVPDAAEPPAEYVPGKREIIFSDRELNGLLNAHTTYGDQVAFSFAPGTVMARLVIPLDESVPILGGKKLRANAKFTLETTGQSPTLALQDLTVWGISVPNDWLGGIKNQNLLEQAFGKSDGGGIPGVESFAIEQGQIIVRLKE